MVAAEVRGQSSTWKYVYFEFKELQCKCMYHVSSILEIKKSWVGIAVDTLQSSNGIEDMQCFRHIST